MPDWMHSTDHLTDVLTNNQSNVILGDFNMHIDDPTDTEANIFNNTMAALGLSQRVKMPTHQLGNTLDLIYMEPESRLSVRKVQPGPLMSDHRLMYTSLNIKKASATEEKVTVCKISAITTEQLCQEFNDDPVMYDGDLNELVNKFNKELSRVIDVLAPPKDVVLSSHKKQPWYDTDVKDQHKVVQNRERVWLKYKLDSTWSACKKERNIYNRLRVYKKRQMISKKVNEIHGDTKGLYKLTCNLTGQSSENLFPEAESDEVLANQFVEYFIQKIEKIHDQLNNTPTYHPGDTAVPQLRKFRQMTEAEVLNIINSMHSKSCELDPILTVPFKMLMDKCLPIVTRIINISLPDGEFVAEWKTSIVRPLLKKLDLELIHKNYHPVSNLSFISKVVKCCALLQFNEHCATYNLVPDFKSAYRPGYSTETSLLKLSNDILWSMEQQQVTMVILLDLLVAFDT